MINWKNPYGSLSDIWLKGNLHAHTAPQSPCGQVPLERVLKLYENAGYDFLSISDHQSCTPVNVPTRLLLIPGCEWNSRTNGQNRLKVNYREHLGIYSLDPQIVESTVEHLTPLEAIGSLGNNGALVVVNHPNWLVPAHYSEEELFNLYQSADGIEIYNALIERAPGAADATMKWDRILTEKGPILGFSSDDSHFENDIGKAYIMVNVQAVNIKDVFSGIASGSFYCSTGVRILGIGRSGDEIYCVSDEDVDIDAVGENGQVFASGRQELRCSWRETDSTYLRFVLYGHAKQKAWSQPFFRISQG